MRMRTAVYLLLTVALLHLSVAQTTYHLPFASTGNAIELTVANNSAVAASRVKVEATSAPSWLHFVSTEQSLQNLNAYEETVASFAFSVDKSAPVNQQQTLLFQITSNGQTWTKEIKVAVIAPETFELFQNYPNPFNPTTVISYQLSVASKVSLRVYNMIGQEVATLVDGEQTAGYHQETLDAHSVASGIYVYQLSATSAEGARVVARRLMAVVK